ncbi:MAG TPA: tRNA-guanine transglycosylase, partial [Nitrospiria bacterium]|nr:tRNA-guanine transglycosylase [Nitrospiria bacterium]
TGELFTRRGNLVIKQARYQEDEKPIDEKCVCYTCRTFSRAYLRHLFVSHEILGIRLNTIHNLYYYIDLMRQIRESLVQERFSEFRENFYSTRMEAD